MIVYGCGEALCRPNVSYQVVLDLSSIIYQINKVNTDRQKYRMQRRWARQYMYGTSVKYECRYIVILFIVQ